MKTLKRFAQILLILAFCASYARAQTALTQTTLSADAGVGPTIFSGTITGFTSTISVASTTGFIASGVPLYIQSVAYVDNEAMAVVAVNTTTKVITVQRGYLSTPAQPHLSGTPVLVGPPGAFQTSDPAPSAVASGAPSNPGACVAANTAFTPFVNVLTGRQWLCSTITKTWVPGFNNPAPAMTVTASVAAAAGAILPSGPFFTITGAGAVTGFTIPVGFNATATGGGCIVVRADTATTATWTNAGNIALGGTFTPNKIFTFCWDANTSKFVPNTIA